jgi:hypothetical protein
LATPHLLLRRELDVRRNMLSHAAEEALLACACERSYAESERLVSVPALLVRLEV